MHRPDPHTDAAPSASEVKERRASPRVSDPAQVQEPLENLALLIAYDGSTLQGWQVQRHGPSVQGRLEEALRTITRQEVRVYGSGRTDAGVHALGQVANCRLPPGRDLQRLRTSLNALLAPSISVHAIVHVPERFHARHSAQGKRYRYQLFNRPYPPVFARDTAWWVKQPLDVDAMRAAAAPLLGEHDFSAFRAAGCEAPHPVRTLRRLEVREREAPACTLAIELEANGFLQHMARILVGTLVEVGLGKLAADEVAGILASRQRERAAATAPPGGLHMVRVFYDLDAFPELRAFEQG